MNNDQTHRATWARRATSQHTRTPGSRRRSLRHGGGFALALALPLLTAPPAAADLGDAGARHIILVSDGEETCAPPGPSEVARKLKSAGIELVVDDKSSHGNPAILMAEAYLPGEDTRWAHGVSIDNEWAHIQPVGIHTNRLTWDQTPAGAQRANVCTVVENEVRATATSHPVETAVELEAQAVSADGQTSPVQPSETADHAVAADDMSSVLDGPAALAGAVLLGVLAGLGIRAVNSRRG